MTENRKTWKQLKAEGVERCYVTFRGGRQCRCRVHDQALPSNHAEWGLCEGHRWVGRSIRQIHEAGVAADKAASARSDWTEDD